MSNEEELVLRVEAETDQARRDLHALEEVAEELEEPIELDVEVEDGPIKDLLDALEKTATEAEQTAAAVKQIGAFAPSVDLSQIERAVNELRAAGVSIDDLVAKAPTIGSSLETSFSRVRTAADDVETSLGKVRDGGDQSRSVLANLAGNAAQDLGELGGVVGSLGVGLGQLAEYAVDGNIALSNLAAVAGPMIALTGALALVNKYMGEADAEFAAQQARIDAFKDAIDEVGPSTNAAAAGLRELSDAVEPDQPDLLEKLGVAAQNLGEDLINLLTLQEGEGDYTVNDLIGDLSAMGYTLEDLTPIISGTDEELAAFLATLREDPASEGRYDRMAAELGTLRDAFHEGETAAKQFDSFFAQSIRGVNDSLSANAAAASDLEMWWNNLLVDMADGAVTTDLAKNAWNALREELDLSEGAMAEMAQNKLAEKLEADAQAAENARQKLVDMAEAYATINDLLATTTDVTRQFADAYGDDLASALDATDDAISRMKFHESFQRNFEEALAGLESFGPDLETLAAKWSDIINGGMSIDLFGNVRADDEEFLSALENIRNLFQEGVVNEFEQGGTLAAQHFVQAQAKAIQEAHPELSMTDIYRLMGLPDNGSVQALIQPTIDADNTAKAKAILDALAGTSDDPRIAEIQMRMLLDPNYTPEQAVADASALGQEYLDKNHLNITADTNAADVVDEYEGELAQGFTTDVEATSNAADVGADIDTATQDRTTQVIVPKSDSLGLMQDLIDHVTRDRTTNINVKADNAGYIDGILDAIAHDRTIHLRVQIDNYSEVERQLEQLARPRTQVITTRFGGSRNGAAVN